MNKITEDAKIPQIRFKGFKDAWKLCKFSEIAETKRGLTYKPTDVVNNGIKVLRSSNINEDHFEQREDDVFVSQDAINIDYVKSGDILITSANGSSRLVGKHAIINNIADNTAVHGGFMLLARTNYPYFLNASMSSNWYEKFINLHVAGGNGAIGNLSKSNLDDYDILVPLNSEKSKIGELFNSIDSIITLHQRKYDKLINVKRSLIDKMFPKDGEKVPRLRFERFNDAWKQRKLSELGKTQSGIGFSESEQGGSDGIPFFKVSDMNNLGNEYEMKIANNYVSFEQLQRRSWKPIEGVPCVIFAKVGAAIMLDRKRIVRIPFLIDNNTMAYIFDGSWDVDFGKYLFETIPLPRYAQVGALPSYNGSDIEDIEVCVPTKEEQTKIAELFVRLENLITLHQRKIEKLKNIKESLLDKMFL